MNADTNEHTQQTKLWLLTIDGQIKGFSTAQCQRICIVIINHDNFSQGALVKIFINSRNKEASCGLE